MTAILSSLLLIQSPKRLRQLTLRELSPQQEPREAPFSQQCPQPCQCAQIQSSLGPGSRSPKGKKGLGGEVEQEVGQQGR